MSKEKYFFPKKNTAKRAAWGSLMNFFSQVIRSLEHIILIPLFLWAWGDAMYGEWMTLFSLIAYLSISDLGMNRYVTNRMTQKFAEGNIKEYLRSFKSAFGMYSIITVILLLLLIVFALSSPLFEWFDFSQSAESQVRTSFIILGFYIILGTISGLVRGLYDSSGDYVRNKVVKNIRDLFLIGFVALALFLGSNFIGVSFVYLFLLIFLILFVLWDVKKRHPEINLSSVDIDWALGKSFLIPGGFFLLIPLSNAIQIQGAVLIISSVIGSVAVASFTVHRTLSNLIQRIVSVIKEPLFPEIAADEQRRNYDKLQTIHSMFLKVALFLAFSAVSFLYFTGGGILRIWTGGEVMLDHSLWVVLLISVPVYTVWHFSSSFLVATNNYNKYSIVRIISSVLGLGLAIALAHVWGAVGVVLGFLIPEALINLWWVPRETTHLIKGRFKDFLSIFGVGLGLAGLLFFVGLPIDQVIENVWIKVISLATVIGGVGASFLYYFWLQKQERKIVDKFIKQSIKKVQRMCKLLIS